jgi:small subunit ribosomal protein S17
MSKRTITGAVTSAAGSKTIVVTRTTRETHPLYGKKFTTSRKFHAHDEKDAAKVGDLVIIEECAPLSRTKTWILKEITQKGQEKFDLKKEEIEVESEVAATGAKGKSDAHKAEEDAPEKEAA